MKKSEEKVRYSSRISIKGAMIALIMLFTYHINLSAQVTPPKETPQLEFVMQLKVTLGETYSVGETPSGRRTVIPITGGTFEGPNIKGTILNGGADYQMANGNRTQIEAIYSIKTDDGVYIHIRNRGLINPGQDEQGKPSFYFRCAPQFEAPSNSPYAWLNNSLFVCAPDFSPGFQGIVLNVWRVK